MVNRMTIRFWVGVTGNVISGCLFAAPIFTFLKIRKKGAVEEFSPNPYLATLLNCLLWVFYGLPFVHPDSILVVIINSIGLVMELGYVISYLYYANKKQRNHVYRVLAGEFIFYAVVVCCTLLIFRHGYEKRTWLVGIFCVLLNISMYAMPLDVLKLVIKTKSVEYMPFLLLVANFLNGLCWLTYALLRFDLFITISNGTGAILGLIQLIVYAIYYKSTPKSSEDKKPTNNKDIEIQGNNI